MMLQDQGRSVLMHDPQYMCNILTTAFDDCVMYHHNLCL